MSAPGEILLIRHTETEWTKSGQHTGRTDIPLTEAGREAARALAPSIACHSFVAVLVSPLQRARETCELCGLAAQAEILPELMEWDYGDYEGLTSAEIAAKRPDWSLWRDGCPGGERTADVGARADAVIARLQALDGEVAIFSHGHLLRVLGARWIELDPACGARLLLSPGSRSTLGHEHGIRTLGRWNVVQ